MFFNRFNTVLVTESNYLIWLYASLSQSANICWSTSGDILIGWKLTIGEEICNFTKTAILSNIHRLFDKMLGLLNNWLVSAHKTLKGWTYGSVG